MQRDWANVENPRWFRAFSIGNGLRALFVPQAVSHGPRLRALDGLRAFSILWVVAFHSAWYSFMVLPTPRYVALLQADWLLPIWRGDFGVDVFFVLSGFLIGGMLLDEHGKTGGIRLGSFYGRRLMRLWPALIVGVAINLIVIKDSPTLAWANLLYVSNFLPILGVGMAWTWSLSIEEQFYLLCPWLVRSFGRTSRTKQLLVIGAALVGGCALAAVIAHRGGFYAFDSEIVLNRDLLRWAYAFDTLYVKPWMRAGALLAGVAAAIAYRTPGIMQAIGRARFASALAFIAALVLGAAATHWPLVFGRPRWLELAYLGTFRTVFGLAVAWTILFVLSEHPLGRGLGTLLSSRILHPFAQLAYSAYLLNPIVAMSVHKVLQARALSSTATPMLLFLPCDFLATFLAAAILHILVERPFMELRRVVLPTRARTSHL